MGAIFCCSGEQNDKLSKQVMKARPELGQLMYELSKAEIEQKLKDKVDMDAMNKRNE